MMSPVQPQARAVPMASLTRLAAPREDAAFPSAQPHRAGGRRRQRAADHPVRNSRRAFCRWLTFPRVDRRNEPRVDGARTPPNTRPHRTVPQQVHADARPRESMEKSHLSGVLPDGYMEASETPILPVQRTPFMNILHIIFAESATN